MPEVEAGQLSTMVAVDGNYIYANNGQTDVDTDTSGSLDGSHDGRTNQVVYADVVSNPSSTQLTTTGPS